MGDKVSNQSLSDLVTGKKKADWGTGAARAAIGQGLMMGWGDEAEAWLKSKIGDGSYEDNLKKVRGEYAQFSKENPWTAGAAEFAGAALPMAGSLLIPGAQWAAPATMARGAGALAKLAGMGAAQGAVSGAGSAEEGSRLSGAGSGAVIGGVTGAAAPVVMRTAGAGGKWLAEKLAPTEARVTNRAAEKMTKAMEEGGLDAQALKDKYLLDRSAGIPSTVANASPALVDLAEAVAQRTGKGARNVSDVLNAQKLGSRERTYARVDKSLGRGGNFYNDEQKLVEDLRKKSSTLYDDAYTHGSVDDPRINLVLQDPEFAGFFNKAKDIANKEAMAAKLRGEDPAKYQLQDIYKMSVDPQTNVITTELKTLPDVRTLDYMKRGIDATIESMYSSGRSAEATALKELRKQFVGALDENVPKYKAARKVYAGDMETLDAMRTGMNDFGKLDHEQVVKMVKDMSDSEKDAFRTGVVRNLYSKIMDPASNINAAQRVIGSPEMQAKLQPLFDNPAQFNLFKSALDRESQLFSQANQVLGGSQTGKRLQMRESLDAAPGAGEAIADAVTGGFWGSLTGMTTRAIRNTQMPEKTAEKLSQMLMAKDPHEVAAVVQLLEKHAAEVVPQAYKTGVREAAVVGGTTGAIWPSPTTQEAGNIEQDSQSAEPITGPDLEADFAARAKALAQ